MPEKKEFDPTHRKKETTESRESANSPDKLTDTGKKSEMELTENELENVSGGCCTGKHFD